MSGHNKRASSYQFCEACQKRGYFSRKDARVGHREHHRSEKGMRPYPCPVGTGLWHLGHMPKVVRTRGIVSATAIFESSYRSKR